MPVRSLNSTRSQEHEALVQELVTEWNDPQSPHSEPVILEERGRGNVLAHVYVVWSKWAHVDRVERSEIIMDAAERRLPVDQVLNITIAMGLTPDEAQRLGIR